MHDQAKLQRMGQFYEQTGCHQAQIEPRSALHPVLADAQLQVEEEGNGNPTRKQTYLEAEGRRGECGADGGLGGGEGEWDGG